VSDELTSQLRELAQEGETPPPVSGAEIRFRAVRRRRRRRTAAAVSGACAATALALVLALNLGGGDGTDRHTPPAASASGVPTTPASPDATVDLSRRALTVNGRTVPISSGSVWTPTPTGRMTVMAKEAVKVMHGEEAGLVDKSYEIKLPWVIELASADGATKNYIVALTYDEKAPGNYDHTHGWIGLRRTDAKWLYEQLRLGAVVDIEGAAPTETPASDGGPEASGGTTAG